MFVEPYQAPQTPPDDDLDFSTKLQAVDLYVLLDRSGSMIDRDQRGARATCRRWSTTSTCPPLGSGTPGDCIPDLWAGAGTIGYQGAGDAAFQNYVDIQPTRASRACRSPSRRGLELRRAADVRARAPRSPASGGARLLDGLGRRRGATLRRLARGRRRLHDVRLPVLPPGRAAGRAARHRRGADLVGLTPTPRPNWASIVKPAFLAAKARLVGILGSGYADGTDTDLRQMATDTGAVDAVNGNAPLVFDGAGANAATAIQTGLSARWPTASRSTSTRSARDDPSDAVDAVAAFVDHLETLQLGTALCTSAA